MKKTKEQIISKIVKDLPTRYMRGEMTDAEWHGWFFECWDEAINYTRCSLQLNKFKKGEDILVFGDTKAKILEVGESNYTCEDSEGFTFLVDFKLAEEII